MTSIISRANPFPELVRLLDAWPLAPFGDHHTVRIEDFEENGHYVLRAELPGVEPGKDIEVTVEGNELTIAAQRSSDKHDARHSEFSYGSFARTVRLPSGADGAKAKADYHAGVLEVTVPIKESKKESKQIPVAVSE